MLHINEVCSENVPVQSSVHVLHVLLLSPCWAVRLSDEGIYRNAEGVSVKIGLRTKKRCTSVNMMTCAYAVWDESSCFSSPAATLNAICGDARQVSQNIASDIWAIKSKALS